MIWWHFFWQGINMQGLKVQGKTRAPNRKILKSILQQQGITIQRIRYFPYCLGFRQIQTKDIAAFTRQLATLLQTGLPLVQALDVMARVQLHPMLQQLILHLKQLIAEGQTLSQALAYYPKQFDMLYCQLVYVGECAAALPLLFARIATYQEKIIGLKTKFYKALIYPCSVFIVAIFITIFLLLFIVPQFQELFINFGANLPWLTVAVIQSGEWLKQYGLPLLLVIVMLIVSLLSAYRRNIHFTHFIEAHSIKLPFFGALLTKAIIARITQTLAITYAAGIPLVEALTIVSHIAQNHLYVEAIQKVGRAVAEGKTLGSSFQSSMLFPPLLIQMIQVGEESSSLTPMLENIANYYEAQIDNAIAGVNQLLEPLIILFLGVLIGALVIAMYLPVFQLGAAV